MRLEPRILYSVSANLRDVYTEVWPPVCLKIAQDTSLPHSPDIQQSFCRYPKKICNCAGTAF